MTSIQLEDMVANVEKSIYETGDSEISSTAIGQLVMEGLSELNDVAYVRFASVYRRFTDLDSFDRELDRLREKLDKVDKKAKK